MKRILILLIILYSTFTAYNQGEIDDQEKIFYRNEKTLGLLLNSNGFGINGRYGKQINARNKRIYNIDIAGIKHPKEYKTPSINYYTSSYIYGKMNSFFVLRSGIGKQHEIFKKIDRGGISIKQFYSFGPALGFFKPIYYKIQSTYPNVFYCSKFDPEGGLTIVGKYSFFKGLNETQITPGAFAKFGCSFEYSTVDEIIHALEAGVVFDGYVKGVPIMANTKKSHFFFTLFLSYRFGKIVNAQFSPKKRREMKKRKEAEE